MSDAVEIVQDSGVPMLERPTNRGADAERGSLRIPEVFAVGPPRTATTWLHGVLKGHVNLPEKIKETRFFDLRYARGLKWYAAHFSHAVDGVPCGEVAPTYFYSAKVRQRISRLVPEAKIICSFRDPVERLYSLYKLKRYTGRLNCSFEHAVEHDPEMIESSRYAFHLSAWIGTFGKDNILSLIYEDLLRDPLLYLERVCRHIGIPPFKPDLSSLTPKYSSEEFSVPACPFWTRLGVTGAAWLAASRYNRIRELVKKTRLRRLFIKAAVVAPPPLDPNVAAKLRIRMRAEVEALEALLELDLSPWKQVSG